jgi:hypothetical protein
VNTCSSRLRQRDLPSEQTSWWVVPKVRRSLVEARLQAQRGLVHPNAVG